MAVRIASCPCGGLRAACEGSPTRVSVCHCLDCQRRSGSAFAAQARFASSDVTLSGERRTYVRQGESGSASFHFCPTCGATVAYETEAQPHVIAVPLGAFADPGFEPPGVSVYEERKHRWLVVLGDEVEHIF